MSNKWADGHLLEYCAQCGKEIYVENIVLDEESDDANTVLLRGLHGEI